MKKLIAIFVLAALLSNCKDSNDPEPLPEVAGIASSWLLKSTEYRYADSTTVVYASIETEPYILKIRHDGIPTSASGKRLCCPPSRYLINGVPFELKPVGEAPPADPQCNFVDCISCPEWKITQDGDTMTVESCGNSKSTYTRQR